MKTPGKRTFEEQWRDAFENAELPPDASVWNQVETHLADAEADKYKRQLHTFKMRMAAAVALLVLALGAGTGWYFAKQQPGTLASAPASTTDGNTGKPLKSPENPIAKNNAPGKPENPLVASSGTTKTKGNAPPGNPLPEPMRSRQHPALGDDENALTIADTPSGELPAGKLSGRESRLRSLSAEKPALARAVKREQPRKTAAQNSISQNSMAENAETPPAVAANRLPEATGKTVSENARREASRNGEDYTSGQTEQTRSWAALTPLTVRAEQYALVVKDIRWQLTDAMWTRIAAEDEAAQQKKSKKQPHSRWQMGLGFASSRFDPNFRTESTPNYVPLSNAYTSRTAVSPVAQDLSRITRPGMAYTTDVQVGFSLSKRFSLQGGVQYRYDNSQLEVSQYLADVAGNRLQPVFYSVLNNGGTANLLESFDGVQNNSPPAPLQASSVYVATFNNAQAQVVDNTYQYVGFPMRLVYKVLNRKVRASVGAGMSADVFVRNRIGGGANNVETIEITPSSNSAYRNLGFSGLLSLKVDYSLGSGSRYSVFIEPAYRKALTSFTASSSLESFPSWWGIGTGFQYRF